MSLTELRAVRGKLGLPVERDEHFDADKTISSYADEAQQQGHIVTQRLLQRRSSRYELRSEGSRLFKVLVTLAHCPSSMIAQT